MENKDDHWFTEPDRGNFINSTNTNPNFAILTNGQRAILAMYYGFISLSSVGFGDFHPINSQERLICAVILVAGNAVFGYIIEIFKEMAEKSKDLLNDQFEEAYELISFFSMLQKFNNNRMITKSMIESL